LEKITLMNTANNETASLQRLEALDDFGIPINEVTDCHVLQKLVGHLFQLLDNIDTAGDTAKSDSESYHAMVAVQQAKRFDHGLTTDGYGLFYKANSPAKLVSETTEADHSLLALNHTIESSIADDTRLQYDASRCEVTPEVSTAFAELIAHCSLYGHVMADEICQALSLYQHGTLTLEECERSIGQNTSAFVAQQLVGDDKELLLAMSEELEALRTQATSLLDTLQPINR
jgi:hypothetical protein